MHDDTLRIKFTLGKGIQGKRKTLTRKGIEPTKFEIDPRCSTDWATRARRKQAVSIKDIMSRQMNTDELVRIAQSAEQRCPSISTLIFLFPCTCGNISIPRANAHMDIGNCITSLYTLLVHFIVMWATVHFKLSSQRSVCLCFFAFIAATITYNFASKNCGTVTAAGGCNCPLLLCTGRERCGTGARNAPTCSLKTAYYSATGTNYSTRHCDCQLGG